LELFFGGCGGEVMRALVVLACLALAGCSVMASDLTDPPPYVPPQPPSLKAQAAGIKQAAQEEKLSGRLEVSDVRLSNFGPGRYMICLRGARASGSAGYYTVFFENEAYKGVRLSVIAEACERQSFRPAP